jgi:hypothetical protein
LDKSACVAKVLRNTYILISRLHPEILSIIFSLLPSSDILDLEYDEFVECDLESSPPTSSLTVSHVCHQWREVSLNQSYLWNHIDFTKLTTAGVAVILVRAKTAPLYLGAQTIRWSEEKFGAFKEQIESHIHHTRCLSITVETKHLMTVAQLVSSASSLELLSIGHRIGPRNSQAIIPDKVFDGIAPKLTYLRLYQCGIGWQSLLLKGLRVLELFSTHFTRPRVTLYYWLRVLKQMPQLERLVLHVDEWMISDKVVLSEGVKLAADLPTLTELSISTSMSQFAITLAHLVLPALTRLCVNAHFGKWNQVRRNTHQ